MKINLFNLIILKIMIKKILIKIFKIWNIFAQSKIYLKIKNFLLIHSIINFSLKIYKTEFKSLLVRVKNLTSIKTKNVILRKILECQVFFHFLVTRMKKLILIKIMMIKIILKTLINKLQRKITSKM